MRIHYSNKEFKIDCYSIFLAGPTPRREDVLSWRPRALEILEKLNFDGGVYVPEWDSFSQQINYDTQVEWELSALGTCHVIAVWLPRDLEKLPGFTTNVEFGRYVDSGRLYYGRPKGAPSTRYLDYLYEKVTNRKPSDTLEDLMKICVDRVVNWSEL